MRALWWPLHLLCLLLLLASTARAQTSNSTIINGTYVPACITDCLLDLVPGSNCTLYDASCICANGTLAESLRDCLSSTCPTSSLLLALQYDREAALACYGAGGPPRDRTLILDVNALVFTIVGLLCVLVRVWTRWHVTRGRLTPDDWCILAVMSCVVSGAIVIHIGALHGFGRDIWNVSTKNLLTSLRLFWALEIIYALSIALIKIAMLLFYLRIFPPSRFHVAIYALIGLISAWGLANLFTVVFQCWPVAFVWDQWDGEHEGSCRDVHTIGWIMAALNISWNVVVLGLPVRKVWRMRMGRRRRLAVLCMFFVGGLDTVISCVRLREIAQFGLRAENPTWDNANLIVWSWVEAAVGIICSCMPALRQFLRMIWPRVFPSLKSDESPAGEEESCHLSRIELPRIVSDDTVPRVSSRPEPESAMLMKSGDVRSCPANDEATVCEVDEERGRKEREEG